MDFFGSIKFKYILIKISVCKLFAGSGCPSSLNLPNFAATENNNRALLAARQSHENHSTAGNNSNSGGGGNIFHQQPAGHNQTMNNPRPLVALLVFNFHYPFF
jgi:hypothetical protein